MRKIFLIFAVAHDKGYFNVEWDYHILRPTSKTFKPEKKQGWVMLRHRLYLVSEREALDNVSLRLKKKAASGTEC